MSFIPLSVAKDHLRETSSASNADISVKLEAAELIAAEYMGRNVYSDAGTLATAIAAVPATLVAAKATYDAAIVAADAMTDSDLAEIEKAHALKVYERATNAAQRTRNGIVMDDLITAGVMLILGDLYESREDTVINASVAQLPNGARALLDFYRVYA